MIDYEDIEPHLKPLGMRLRGGFYDLDADHTLVLIGNVGSDIWGPFSRDQDKWVEPNPLDHWTEVNLSKIADRLKGDMIFPFIGPDYAPFQTWALRADCVYASPIGPLIHPEYGLWHAYRAALVFKSKIKNLPQSSKHASPCETCVDKPCVQSCPAHVFDAGDYDVPGCVTHLQGNVDNLCLSRGCLARRACPIGVKYQYNGEHSAFHMERFLSAFGALA